MEKKKLVIVLQAALAIDDDKGREEGNEKRSLRRMSITHMQVHTMHCSIRQNSHGPSPYQNERRLAREENKTEN